MMRPKQSRPAIVPDDPVRTELLEELEEILRSRTDEHKRVLMARKASPSGAFRLSPWMKTEACRLAGVRGQQRLQLSRAELVELRRVGRDLRGRRTWYWCLRRLSRLRVVCATCGGVRVAAVTTWSSIWCSGPGSS